MLTVLLLPGEMVPCLRLVGNDLSRVKRKPVFGVSDQVRHKRGCATTEDG